MITERTIENLVDKLEEAAKLLESSGQALPKDYIKSLKWLIYDTRSDLNLKRYEFEDLVGKSELEEAKRRIEALEDEEDYLEDEEDY